MQTAFSPTQLADPHTAESEKILRACVHCGFCTATCPTYVTGGNELDSPRGRIILIKDMLEKDQAADAQTVKHIDRCLSCLACMTTCPSGVHYMHLVDHARAHIEKTYRRPLPERLLRASLAHILPYPRRFRAALALAKLGRPAAPWLEKFAATRPLGAMLTLAPERLPGVTRAPVPATTGAVRKRVAVLRGCAQAVLDPGINAAAERLLARLGVAVVEAPGEGCCGALTHHLGRDEEALDFARANVDAWTKLIEKGLDAILVTASGCGTVIKDYGFMLRLDPAYAAKAGFVSGFALDITEFLSRLELPPATGGAGVTVAYHSACSMQHGQKVFREPKALLANAGFAVKEPREGHLCCGSAGTYNITQPEIAAKLRERKVRNIEATGAALVATGNIGCMTQIGSGTRLPVVHTVELLDWAYGGPKPAALAAIA